MAIFGFRARLTHALSISPSAECFGNYTGSIQCIVKALGHTALISLLLLSRAHIALTVLCCQTLLLVPSTLSVSHCAWSNMFVRTCSTSRSSAVSPICTSQRFIFTGLVVHQPVSRCSWNSVHVALEFRFSTLVSSLAIDPPVVICST